MRLRVRGPVLNAGIRDTRRLETSDENEILAWAEDYAKKNGWGPNPDKELLAAVIRGLARNKKKYGERYCPCRIRSGDKEKDRALICPCIFHEDEIAREGHCHCRLYYRKDANKSVTEGQD